MSSNQVILEKVIQKAIDGGWLSPKKPVKSVVVQTDDGNCYFQLWAGTNDMLWSETWDSVETLIFDHDFCKAIWPDGEYGLNEVNGHWYKVAEHDDRSYVEIYPAWEYHIREMVVCDNPIDYLKDFV